MRSEAKHKYLILKSNDIAKKKDLKDLYGRLRDNISPPQDGTERINYKDFKAVGEQNELFHAYFLPSNFLKFDKDQYGRIDIIAFFHYIIKRNTIESMKLNVAYFDYYCEGFLIDKDIEQYITKEVQSFPFYNDIEREKQDFYLLVAQRKFFFHYTLNIKAKYISTI